MIADSAARARALDVGRSFIVQAPAGSGKTELLIQRFLKLLETVDAPGSVIAITFTKKAAGEMRARILGALRAAQAGNQPDSEHQRTTYEIARRVLETDQRFGWDLIRNPARIRIETIDALCASITRRMPWVARFGAMPDITEKSTDLYREAARNTLRHADDGDPSLACLLLHLDNDFAIAERLLVNMLERREQWLNLTGVQPDFDRVRAALEATLDRLIVKHLHQVLESIDSADAADMSLLRGWKRFPRANVEDVDLWQQVADLLLTGDDKWRKTVNSKLGFPPNHPLKPRFENLLARVQDDDSLLESLRLLRKLPAPRFTESQWLVLQSAVSVLTLAAAELQLVFRKHRCVDFAELSLRALAALGPRDAPTDLGLALGYGVRHLLVDEFQDTSYVQFELLEKLTAGWEPGDGRTLFLVGDPMQSIYRFRQADVSLFIKAREAGIGQILLEPLTLSVNFRSPQGIVSWVNRMFLSILPAKDDVESSAVAYSPSDPVIEGTATVRIHAFETAEQEARCVLGLVREALGKTAILVRSRAHLIRIVAELKQARIPFQAVEIDALSDKPVVEDLMALTQALLHLADRVSWLALLRAPWCGLTLTDLHALAGEDRNAAVWDLLHRPGLAMSDDGMSRVARIEPILARALAQRARLPLRDWVEVVWFELGGPAGVDAIALSDAAAYLDLLEGIEQGADLADFTWVRQQVMDLFAQVDAQAGDRLQLMTIHKAKGLEFDTVILPSLNERARSDDSQLLVWLEEQGEFLLAVKPETGQDKDRIYSYIEAVERRKAQHEAARLLYVAATRARRSLHLVGALEKKEDGTYARPNSGSFLDLLQRGGVSLDPSSQAEVESNAEPARRLRRFVRGWQPPSPPPPVREQRAGIEPVGPLEAHVFRAGETARHIGTAVHGFLQKISQEGLSAWNEDRVRATGPRYRAVLTSLGVPRQELPNAAARVEAALLATIRDPRGRWILEVDQEAECEAALSGVVNGVLIDIVVDRTFIDEAGIRWVIDYKTSEPHGVDLEAFLDEERARYEAQLERYASLLAKRDSRVIRLGLYFPLTGGWREWGAATVQRSSAAQGLLFDL